MSSSKRYPRLDEGKGLGAVSKGSYGRVYAAVDQLTKRTVAVKRQLLPSDEAARELAFYSALSHAPHPNVMCLHDHFTAEIKEGACLYMVFEFMDTTLWSMWKQRRRILPLEMVQSCLRQTAAGLGHLHACGIVHTDLSMANVLVASGGFEPRRGGVVRIADLGGAASAIGMVIPEKKVKSTEYVRSPEVILGERELTPAVDLWALGVVALGLCCGSLVFCRVQNLDPAVQGLNMVDEVEEIFPGSVTFGNQVAFLGSGGLEPSLGALPRWPLAGELAGKITVMREQPSAFLSDSSLVLRPVGPDDPMAAFILALLCWKPATRLPATECARHAYLAAAVSNNVADLVVARVSEASLRAVVVESLRSGLPVDYERLLATCMVPASEQSTDVSDGVRVPVARQESATKGNLPDLPISVKRRRYHSKQAEGEGQGSSHVPSELLLQPALSQAVVSVPRGSPAPQLESAQLRRCSCRGNCGRRSCKARKNLLHRYGAAGVAAGGDDLDTLGVSGDGYCDSLVLASSHGLCTFCACERCREKCRMEHYGQSRWCCGCARQLGIPAVSPRTTSRYFNINGSFRVERTWSPQLQLTAKYAWVYRLGPAVGDAYWEHFVSEFMDWRGVRRLAEVRHPGDVMFLLLISCVRWPQVLFQVFDALDGFEPRGGCAADWYAYLVRLLRVASGNSWKAMFDEISQGRNRCCTGLLWLCMALEIVAVDPRDATPGEVVTLGVSQKTYVIAGVGPGSQRLKQVLEGVYAAGFAFPDHVASSQDISSYSSRVKTLVDLIVGRESQMARGSVTRALLSLLQREHDIQVWDGMSMSDLAALLPDENSHLTPLFTSQAGAVRTRFGMSPLAVSGMACLWGTVNQAHLDVLSRATNKEILNVVTAPLDEPMASSQVQAARCGRVLRSIPVPAVWVARMHQNHKAAGE